MLYLNIERDLSFIMSEDKKYKQSDLISLVTKEIQKSKWKVLDLSPRNKRFVLTICNKENKVNFDLFLKNITGAGWADKPDIKRCQVSNFKSIHELFIITDKHYNLILGYYNFNNNPIFVAWDAYRYLNHNTIRSCYVTVDTLKRGYEKGFYEGVVSSQKCWVFLGEKFDLFVKRYIEYINDFYMEELHICQRLI